MSLKTKKLVFISNFFNHHQKPLSDALYARLGDGYLFIETGVMSEERKKLGWGMKKIPSYVVSHDDFFASREKYNEIIDSAEAVIIGSTPEDIIRRRKKLGKLIFRYAERPLKKGLQLWKYIPRYIKWHIKNPKGKQIYILCASAYTSGDFRKFGLFKNRAFKWGYFPETRIYDNFDTLMSRKKKNSIVWVARFIDWKHPEKAVKLAKLLKDDGYEFEMNLIGNGEMFEYIKQMVLDMQLSNEVRLLGAMKPEEVRAYMEASEIHIFTSDRCEGWGAVLNESMNSGCVPVADLNIGSTPFLIENGKNGFAYTNEDELYKCVKHLLKEEKQRQDMARRAYATIREEWNAKTAADKLLLLIYEIASGNNGNAVFATGVCSSIK